MRCRLINDAAQKSYALILESGDEVLACLAAFALHQEVPAGQLTAVGAFSDAILGLFDLRAQEYRPITLHDQVEVLSLTGSVALHEGRARVHAHAIVGDRQGHARGGHLLKAHVRPTLEIIITERPAPVQWRHESDADLSPIRFA